MEPALLLGAAAVAFVLAGGAVGYAVGQGLCRRDVRKHLWALWYTMDEGDEPPVKAKYDVLELIRKLELN